MSSEHDVRVVRLGAITKHPNADTLSVTEVDGRPVILRTGEYQEGDLAVYVPIDSVVPDQPRWAFLGKPEYRRIRAKRLRGVFSMGLLTQPEPGWVEGQDVREAMGIEVYEPPPVAYGGRGGGLGGAGFDSGQAEPDPGVMPPYTDIESLRKYRSEFAADEVVVCSEKVHGSNMRALYAEGRLWVGSRNQMKRPPPTWPGGFDEHDERAKDWRLGAWWEAALDAGLAGRLQAVPCVAVYGEVYGQVQDLKYGVAPQGPRVRGEGTVKFTMFDAFDTAAGRWYNVDEVFALAERLGLPTVPVLYRGPFGDIPADLAEGPSPLAAQNGVDHVREGYVVRPLVERWSNRLGRVIAKMVGEGYLTRKGG